VALRTPACACRLVGMHGEHRQFPASPPRHRQEWRRGTHECVRHASLGRGPAARRVVFVFSFVYSAGTDPGDIVIRPRSLNTSATSIGVLAVSELLLVALLWRFPRLALSLVVWNAASRAAILYAKLPLATSPSRTVIAVSVAVRRVFLLLARYRLAVVLAATLALVVGGPFIVERNRGPVADRWADMKPALARPRDSLGLAVYDDWGYFAGHIFLGRNPVHPAVRACSPKSRRAARRGASPLSGRPAHAASAAAAARRLHQRPTLCAGAIPSPADSGLGSCWNGPFRLSRSANTSLDAGTRRRERGDRPGMPVLSGHVLRNGDIVAGHRAAWCGSIHRAASRFIPARAWRLTCE